MINLQFSATFACAAVDAFIDEALEGQDMTGTTMNFSTTMCEVNVWTFFFWLLFLLLDIISLKYFLDLWFNFTFLCNSVFCTSLIIFSVVFFVLKV